jgi:hypothetical protein
MEGGHGYSVKSLSHTVHIKYIRNKISLLKYLLEIVTFLFMYVILLDVFVSSKF